MLVIVGSLLFLGALDLAYMIHKSSQKNIAQRIFGKYRRFNTLGARNFRFCLTLITRPPRLENRFWCQINQKLQFFMYV